MTLPAPVEVPASQGNFTADAGPLRKFMREVAADGVPGASYLFPEPVKKITTISMHDQARLGVRCALRKIAGQDGFYNVYFTKLTAADVEAVKAKLAEKANETARTIQQINGAQVGAPSAA